MLLVLKKPNAGMSLSSDIRWIGQPKGMSDAVPAEESSLLTPGTSDEPLTKLVLPATPVYRTQKIARVTVPLRLREEVNERVQRADRYLRGDFGLTFLGGYIDGETQEQIDSHPSDLGCRSLYVGDDAPLFSSHPTGAAVDVTLSYRSGPPLSLGTDFGEPSDEARLMYFEEIECAGWESTSYRDLRRLLATAMLRSGFAPGPEGWWHWSYGDRNWAAFYGEKPIYGDI